MSGKQRPIAMVKSDPCPPTSYVREAKSPGVVLPIPQMGSIHRDSMLLCSVSEPNLILSSESQVCDADAPTKFSHTDEQLHVLHASGPVSRLLPPNGRTRLIRFQSHVRITSGISRSHKKPNATSHVADIDMSTRSSPASSRASSVYAPLRSRSDDENPTLSLGMAHHLRKAARRGRKRSKDNEKIRERCLCEQARKRGSSQISNERTPLLNCTIQLVFEREGTDVVAGDSHFSHAVDFIFGTWPGRLLNRHWWWWKMEPILCCHCLDESDVEY